MNKKQVRLTESDLHKIVKESVNKVLIENEMPTIPNDFVEYNNNRVDLGTHKLIYTSLGCREGRSESTTIYRQKVTVITVDGKEDSIIYTQRGDESCKWKMYDVYEYLCHKLGIQPAAFG